MNLDDELIIFADETLAEPVSPTAESNVWRILVVDDEQGVHDSTRYALAGYPILGKRVEVISALNGQQARALLAQEEFAVILLDVVMEESDSGLQLVGFIREQLQQLSTRIVLRTGQPGYAPELEVIEKFDINDYKSKSELTRTRLITTLTSALRSFQQLQTINANRTGLMMIIDAAAELFKEKAVNSFSQGVLIQLCSLLEIEENGIFCCFESCQGQHVEVLAAFGKYQSLEGSQLESTSHPNILSDIQQVLKARQHLYKENHVVLYLNTPFAEDLVVWVETSRKLSATDERLLELFSLSVAVGFDNAKLFERIEKHAFSDPLTQLYNRTGLLNHLSNHINTAPEQAFSLLFFDLDNFQSVNDGLGYDIGNACLQTCSQLLKDCFGQANVLARLASDNFCILLPLVDAKPLQAAMQTLQTRLAQGLVVGQHQLAINLTCGIAQYPTHGQASDDLLKNAGIALKQAKKDARGGFVIFDNRYEKALHHRLNIANQLAHCVSRNELELHYQPQVNMKTGELLGAEALVRWSVNNQLISPADFIPIAETSGHIVEMGYWILNQACVQQVIWAQQVPNFCMAVNLSMRQLKDPNFLSRLDEIIAKTGIKAAQLELEITESMMMQDRLALIALVYAIRSRGIKVAMDDFGTGYSSLSYLQNLPIDRLKIDRSFVDRLHQSVQKQAIVRLIIDIGETLQLDIIAEGVESHPESQYLISQGCLLGQGFYFSKPLTQAQFDQFLTTQQTATP